MTDMQRRTMLLGAATAATALSLRLPRRREIDLQDQDSRWPGKPANSDLELEDLRSSEVCRPDRTPEGRHWVLANRTAWQALPDDLRALAAGHLNQSALDQRADLASLNTSLRADLEAKGMVFNEVEKAGFRDRLRQAGFYKEWRERYGEGLWKLLETYAGNLS